MGLGPIPSTSKALRHAGITADQIDRVEFNEAFAAQVIPSCQELGIPMDRVNVNGGSIAIGHPLGATGARLVLDRRARAAAQRQALRPGDAVHRRRHGHLDDHRGDVGQVHSSWFVVRCRTCRSEKPREDRRVRNSPVLLLKRYCIVSASSGMLGAMTPAASVKSLPAVDVVDGRTARAARTNDAVVDAWLSLIEEGDLRPGARRIAERAGVSLRSVFHHFEDLETLYATAAERQLRRFFSGPPLSAEGSLAERIERFVGRKVAAVGDGDADASRGGAERAVLAAVGSAAEVGARAGA